MADPGAGEVVQQHTEESRPAVVVDEIRLGFPGPFRYELTHDGAPPPHGADPLDVDPSPVRGGERAHVIRPGEAIAAADPVGLDHVAPDPTGPVQRLSYDRRVKIAPLGDDGDTSCGHMASNGFDPTLQAKV
ncbi:hypothetical protein SLA_1092 [Streptomyces laurentii]|uniref:Uncharacterized protein n=1 Tax=Streptomyces laurentii TaxID=39478 RepID=A0A160NVT7_STRLU|nr:hypothetical protein SLA_1092 [Streptomyces laurentii]